MENEKLKKRPFGERVDEFFDKNYALFFAPLLVGMLYVIALISYGVSPFGDEYTAASYDLSAQICPFIEHLFDVLQGKSTLTYSYAIVGGADVTGTFLYFFISPFSFLFLIFGDGKVDHASSIVMLCKLMATAFAGTWFAKKLFQNIPDYICVVVGAAYAYCGYTFVANTYINWVDFLIYLPFCAAAFRRFVKTGKFFAFSLLVSACIYTCFSIACFSMFTVFPTLIGYAVFCVKRGERKSFIAYLCLSFAVAILMALPVLLPALSAYLNSARGGSIFENIWYGFTVSKETGIPENFNSSTFIESYSESLYRKWSYIATDSVFVVLTLSWFMRKGLKEPFAKFMLLAGVFTLLPLLVDEAMLLMNMGSYMSYALRFGFLNALYFLGGGCLALDGICFEKNKAFDGKPLFVDYKKNDGAVAIPATYTPSTENEGGRYELNEEILSSMPKRKGNKGVYICTGVLCTLGALALAFLAFFCFNKGYKEVYSLFIEDKELLDSLDSFASRFAHSLGGLEVVVVPFAVVAILGLVGGLMVAFRKVSPRMLSFVLVAVVGLQVVFYNDALVTGNNSTQHVKVGNYQVLSEELNARNEGEYFRVKDYNDKFTANIPFSGGANSFSVFSSVIDADNFTTFQLFGYLGNGKNSFKSTHNSGKSNRSDEFGDSFMGYKYFFVYAGGKDAESTLTKLENSKKYLKKVMTIAEDGQETHLRSGDYYVYENTIVFPSAYRVSGESFRFVKPNTNNSTNRKYNQEALYEYLRGKNLKEFTGSQFVTPNSATELSQYLWSTAADVEVGAGEIRATVKGATAGEGLLLNFVASKGYTVTVNGKKAELVENDLKLLMVHLEEGDNEVVFTYSSPYLKYMAVGVGGAIVGLLAVWFVLKKTKMMDVCSGVIAVAGVLLALGVVAFFMVYPTCVFASKLLQFL